MAFVRVSVALRVRFLCLGVHGYLGKLKFPAFRGAIGRPIRKDFHGSGVDVSNYLFFSLLLLRRRPKGFFSCGSRNCLCCKDEWAVFLRHVAAGLIIGHVDPYH